MTPYPYQLATEKQKALGSPWWCIHHNVRLELLREPIENRVKAIRQTKAPHERETRLRALRPLIGRLPAALDNADAKREKAYDEWKKAYAKREKAYDEKDNAEWEKAYDEKDNADAEWEKAYDEWNKAYDEWEKAAAKWRRANAERKKAYKSHAAEVDMLWAAECADILWGPGGLIFPEAKS